MISLRIKAALSISSPSKPLNAAIDGLVLTLVDHATLATIKIVAAAILPTRLLETVRHLSRSLVESSGLPPEIGQQFIASGGFAIAVVAVVVGNYEILLSNASQVEPDGTLLPIQGQGVLLTRENPIIRVELWAPGARDNITPGGSVNV